MRQPSNIYGDGSGPSRILAPGLRSFISTLFSQGKYVLDAELNLAQWLQAEANAAEMREVLYSGFSKMGQFFARPDFDASSLTHQSAQQNGLYLGPSTVFINGYRADIAGADTLTSAKTTTATTGLSRIPLATPPTSGTRDDLVFLEAWFQEVGPTAGLQEGTAKRTATINQYGKQTSSLDGTTPSNDGTALPSLSNDLQDPTVAAETAGRVQLCWRWRVQSGIATNAFTTSGDSARNNTREALDMGAVYAQANTAAPQTGAGGSNGTTAYTFKRATAAASASWGALYPDDLGLYIAGTGANADGVSLGTLDGFVYALPVAVIHRRNNGSGATQSTANYSLGTTNNPNGAVNYNSTYGLNGTISAGLVSSVYSYRFSDRPDGKFADVIEADDIIDLRHQVYPAGFNAARLLNQSVQALGQGLLQTRDIQSINATTLDTNNVPQGILNRLMSDQLATGSTQVSGTSRLTDGFGNITVSVTGASGTTYFVSQNGATNPTSVSIRRCWADGTLVQYAAFHVFNSVGSNQAYTFTISGGNAVWADVLPDGTAAAYQSGVNLWGGATALTSAPIGLPTSTVGTNYGGATGVNSGLGTKVLSVQSTASSFTLVVGIKWTGRNGLTHVPMNSERGLANSPNPYAPLLRVQNFYASDPFGGDWGFIPLFQDPRGTAAAATQHNPLPGTRWLTTGANQDTLVGFYPWTGNPQTTWPNGQMPYFALNFTGNGTATLQIGNNGSGGLVSGQTATTGTAKVYGKNLLWCMGANGLTVSSQQINADGSITLTLSAATTNGVVYTVWMVPDMPFLMVDPQSRSILEIVRPRLLSATANGTDATYSFFVESGCNVITGAIGPGTNNRLAFYSSGGAAGPFVNANTTTSGFGSNGLRYDQTFNFTPVSNSVVKVAVLQSWVPQPTDQLVVHYAATAYQGRAYDFNTGALPTAGTAGPTFTVVNASMPAFASTMGTGVNMALYKGWATGTQTASTASPAPQGSGITYYAAPCTGFNAATAPGFAEYFLSPYGPLGYNGSDTLCIRDTANLATFAVAQPQSPLPIAQVGGSASVLASSAKEGLSLIPSQLTASAVRGYNVVGLPNVWVESFDRPVLPQSNAGLYRTVLLAQNGRLYLGVAVSQVAVAQTGASFGSGQSFTAFDWYEIAGRPLIKPSAL